MFGGKLAKAELLGGIPGAVLGGGRLLAYDPAPEFRVVFASLLDDGH